LIVGIDPGTNTGIAILDMRGSVVYISSRRSISKSGIIRALTKFGKPLIIAVDVNPAPKNIEKIASSVGAELFTPFSSLSTKGKASIVKQFVRKYEKLSGIRLRFKSRHEKDALAAALKALKANRQLIRKVDNALHKEGLENIFDEVIRMIVKDQSENITNAINEILYRKSRGKR
jgi:predicted RNase H-like nuclease (RuvC/YqgF family)